MKQMIFIFRVCIVFLLVASTARAEDDGCAPENGGAEAPVGACASLPWPFPWAQEEEAWAKECEINWPKLSGNYVIPGARSRGAVRLQIKIVDRPSNKKLVEMRRFKDDLVVSEGYTYIDPSERMIRLSLESGDKRTPSQMAILKLYHATNERSCSADALVPILTLESMENQNRRLIQFRLVRQEAPTRGWADLFLEKNSRQ